jgi:hypothetical protein
MGVVETGQPLQVRADLVAGVGAAQVVQGSRSPRHDAESGQGDAGAGLPRDGSVNRRGPSEVAISTCPAAPPGPRRSSGSVLKRLIANSARASVLLRPLSRTRLRARHTTSGVGGPARPRRGLTRAERPRSTKAGATPGLGCRPEQRVRAAVSATAIPARPTAGVPRGIGAGDQRIGGRPAGRLKSRYRPGRCRRRTAAVDPGTLGGPPPRR